MNKVTLVVATLLILYTLLGYLLLPYFIERFLPPKLSHHFDSQVTLQQVKINPFKLTLEAKDFHIKASSSQPLPCLKTATASLILVCQ
jgi:hypothetical protein